MRKHTNLPLRCEFEFDWSPRAGHIDRFVNSPFTGPVDRTWPGHIDRFVTSPFTGPVDRKWRSHAASFTRVSVLGDRFVSIVSGPHD